MKRAKAIAVPNPYPYGANELKMLSDRLTFKAFAFSISILTAISFTNLHSLFAGLKTAVNILTINH